MNQIMTALCIVAAVVAPHPMRMASQQGAHEVTWADMAAAAGQAVAAHVAAKGASSVLAVQTSESSASVTHHSLFLIH